ncbi:Lytic transglycosylase catalytic [Burkholderia multivorans]
MRRLLCLIVLSLGLAQQAFAQQNDGSIDNSNTANTNSSTSNNATANPGASASGSGSGSVSATPSHDTRIATYLTQKFGVAKEKAAQLADIVNVTATKYALPPAMVYAIISIESRFKEKAHGAGGATGLMQVVPGAHRGLLRNVKDLTEPTTNVDVGSKILSGYVKSAGGDMSAALKSYGGSHAYAQKVMDRVEAFRHMLEPRSAMAAPAPGELTPVGAPAMPAPTPAQASSTLTTQ